MAVFHIDFASGRMVPQTEGKEALEFDYPIGTPMHHRDMANDRIGWVCGHDDSGVEVVWDDESRVSTLYSSIVERYKLAAYHDPITPEQAEAKKAIARSAEAQALIEAQKKRAEREEAERAFKAEFERRLPEGHKGLVVAEYRVDESDLMTDYFGHKTTRSVIIGYTKTARHLFSNMRKFAAQWEETAHLADGPKSFEHRENYSMGGGNYLKEEGRHCTGWSVSIVPADWAPRCAEFKGAAE